MKNAYGKDGKVFARHFQDNYAHLHEQGIWIFGDWDKALHVAGFEPKTTRKLSIRDEEKIIIKIRAMRKKHLPLYAKYAMDNDGKLLKAALRQFGSLS